MHKNEVMWRIFVPKGQEVTAGQKKFHEEVFCNFCSSPNITGTGINWLRIAFSVKIL
jgi:hypothetical protein